jgi:tyrosyl-tRNA synthetase
MSTITDAKLIDKFLTRGVDKILPDVDGLRSKLLSGERLTAYMGFDPTGPYLHVGHAMGIRSLALLQKLGHKVVFLVGDYTALVGDPDKDSTRKLLTQEEIASNMAGWKEQAGMLIDFEDKDNPVEFAGNHQWLSKLNLNDLIGLMSKMTVQQMLERELFQKRIKENNPLQLQELIYPLMQGYDSVAMKVDLELGGTDQIFNMMVGRDLVRSYLGKDKYVRAHKMMPAPDSLTMSKTKGNGINLADSAQDMYGKAMSYKDEHILEGLELLTDTPESELEEIATNLKKGENPMHYKKLLAFRLVEIVRGSQAANEAEQYFQDTVQNRQVSTQRTKISLKLITAALLRGGDASDPTNIVSSLMESSKGSAKQLIKQGGVEVNSQKCLIDDSIELAVGDIIKVGKRNWFEIVD